MRRRSRDIIVGDLVLFRERDDALPPEWLVGAVAEEILGVLWLVLYREVGCEPWERPVPLIEGDIVAAVEPHEGGEAALEEFRQRCAAVAHRELDRWAKVTEWAADVRAAATEHPEYLAYAEEVQRRAQVARAAVLAKLSDNPINPPAPQRAASTEVAA